LAMSPFSATSMALVWVRSTCWPRIIPWSRCQKKARAWQRSNRLLTCIDDICIFIALREGPILEHHSLTGILHRSHQRHSLQPALVYLFPVDVVTVFNFLGNSFAMPILSNILTVYLFLDCSFDKLRMTSRTDMLI
jgi:hypothetical protein